jgi:hypothetical protein
MNVPNTAEHCVWSLYGIALEFVLPDQSIWLTVLSLLR